MKTLFLLLFINCLCIAQPRIKSLDDIPTSNPEKNMRYAKLMLSKLQTLPDTINNEWEKYTIRFVNRDERSFYADDNNIRFEAEPWYFDTLAHNTPLRLDFIDVLKKDSSLQVWSYNATHILLPEEVFNIFNVLEDINAYNDLGKIPPFHVEYPLDDDFFVIEKTIRTKKHQIIHQLLAIAPSYTVRDRHTGYPGGRKLLCWFVLK
jgi:hypothetical protein